MIDRETIARITEAANIVEVVSDYVRLQRRGANFMGLCPFHNERTPSFSVSPRKNFCYCFSCKKGGAPVNFIMQKEGISYHDALLHLAKKYGIEVNERELTDEEKRLQSERDAMLSANEWAMMAMERNLKDTEEGRSVGLSYFYQRGVTAEAIAKFHLGYAIDSGRELSDAAKKAGFDTEILYKTGLIGKSQDGRYYDKFRGRVIFPIQNSGGKVVGFGGRDLKGSAAKYINSQESPIYKKNQELYGLFQAKNAITREGRCYLVEGYMDVIGMWQSGLQNVVASSGTALTDGQIALIHRFTDRITLIYDGDAAGIKAALRGVDMLLSHKLDVDLLLLPDGDDPDSFARKHTAEEFRDYVEENSVDVIRFKTQVLLKDASDPMRRAEAIRSIVGSIASIPDEIKRYTYIQECSKMLKVPEDLLVRQVAAARREVVVKTRQERERNLIERDYQTEETSDVKPEGKVSDTPVQAAIQLQPYEQKVVRYCVRYAMMDFCEGYKDDGSDEPEWLSTVRYVAEELHADGMSFSNEVYAKVFSSLLQLEDSYRTDLRTFLSELDAELASKLNREYDHIRAEASDMRQISKMEAKAHEDIEEERGRRIDEFSSGYAGRILASSVDDDVRTCVTEMLADPYSLSKYHYKTGHVYDEAKSLVDLLPRALNEWKNGILALRIEEIKALLTDACLRDDKDSQRRYQEEILELMNQRRDISGYIGDRVVAPKRHLPRR